MALHTNAIHESNKKTKYQNKFKFDIKMLLPNLEILNIKSEKNIITKNFNPYFLKSYSQD